MNNKTIKINVMMDDKAFRDFAAFDIFCRQRRWVSLAAFAAIMLAFALVCFAMRSIAGQAVMLGCVLLAVGFGLPAAYIYMFSKSIKLQSKKLNLIKAKSVYSLELSDTPDGVRVWNEHDKAQYQWSNLYGAYRLSGYVYLYVLNNKAFILPVGQAESEPDKLWELISSLLPDNKLHDCRKSKK